MRFSFSGLALIGCALALAACTAEGRPSSAPFAQRGTAPLSSVPGGVYREGGSIASMADQYARPHLGPVPAAGASAWVRPAPPPAFVATGPMPPAGPEAPSPIEVAIQPPPPASAADVVRPEAGAPELAAAPPAAPDAAVRAAGLKLFTDFSCGACHAFADAGASGAVGPSLDGSRTKAFVVDVVTHGRGAMPAFGGQMSDAEIATLADYLVGFARK